jgi:NADP-dependent 3-hydroxy acid dehydrogenase YdfG
MTNEALSRGDRVIASGKSLSKLQQAFSPNPDLYLLELDVTSGPEVITAKITEAAKIWGRIDVVVNNAGIGIPALLEEGG